MTAQPTVGRAVVVCPYCLGDIPFALHCDLDMRIRVEALIDGHICRGGDDGEHVSTPGRDSGSARRFGDATRVTNGGLDGTTTVCA